MDDIRWKVTDPLGNEIFLAEDNFRYHIIGTHLEKDAQAREKLEEQVKYCLHHPRFIVKDNTNEARRVYLDLADVLTEGLINIRPLFVVVEESNEVVTWFAKRTINIRMQDKGGIIYDRRIHNL